MQCHLDDIGVRHGSELSSLSRDVLRTWERFLAQGWIDATRHFHPRERLYTFWVNADAFRRNAGFRMDFLMVSPSLAPRLRATGIDTEYRGREKPSDHTPVWVELSAGPGG